MAKSRERIQARFLRRNGRSVKDIARRLGVASSTVSIWCRDIVLTPAQVQRLTAFVHTRGYAGRMKGARMNHDRRLQRIRAGYYVAHQTIGRLSRRDRLIAGSALYWAEGSRKGVRRFRFANSDPAMIQFMIQWLRDCFDIGGDRLTCRVLINRVHRNREREVVQFWNKCTGIPVDVFRRTIFINTNAKKIYEHPHLHYGTLHLEVLRGADIIHRIHGHITILSGRSLQTLLRT